MSDIITAMLEEVLPSEGQWMKGKGQNYDGSRRCLWVSLGTARQISEQGREQFMDTACKVRDVILEQYPDRVPAEWREEPGLVIVTFNDHEDTGYRDVRVVLEKAAAKEDSR
jgi:hypothetical protein